MNRNNERIAERLTTLRAGRCPEEVAGAVGISSFALQEYESGKRVPNDAAKYRIAEYYGVPVESIFFLPCK